LEGVTWNMNPGSNRSAADGRVAGLDRGAFRERAAKARSGRGGAGSGGSSGRTVGGSASRRWSERGGARVA
jgi:hypothetical protein